MLPHIRFIHTYNWDATVLRIMHVVALCGSVIVYPITLLIKHASKATYEVHTHLKCAGVCSRCTGK